MNMNLSLFSFLLVVQKLGLNMRQIKYIQDVCEDIVGRSSYGVLFIKKDQV